MDKSDKAPVVAVLGAGAQSGGQSAAAAAAAGSVAELLVGVALLRAELLAEGHRYPEAFEALQAEICRRPAQAS